METILDRYSWRARVLPVYLAVAPIPLALATILPGGLDLPLGGVAAVVLVPLSFLASQIGADFGKRLERRLWREWNGAPATRYLRHSNREYNMVTRERIHHRLRTIGLAVPSPEDEERDSVAADAHYESLVGELIRRTRDSSRFQFVFKALADYGFRRNLLGLKPIAVPIAALGLLSCLFRLCFICDPEKLPAVAITPALLTLGLLLAWLAWVNERAVALAADRYARFLLEAALDLE